MRVLRTWAETGAACAGLLPPKSKLTLVNSAQFRKRISSLYSGQRKRAKLRLLATVPRGVKITLANDEILPYTMQQFLEWLWERVGQDVFPCRYCRTLIDFNSLAIDHRIPLVLGGGLDLDNQDPICSRCNCIKGEMMPEDFEALMEFLIIRAPQMRKYVEGCLLLAPEGKRNKFYPHAAAR